MDTTSLFTAALQLPDPWRVSGVEFRDEEDGRRELHIAIGFAAGSRFPCPEPGCGEAACPVHDARERVWRHLNFFQYKAFIHAGVPRVTCPAHGVHAVPVPWAGPGSGFTLLFEAMVVELAKSQPVADIAEQVGEHDTRLWRFIRRYVDEARLYEDYTGVEAIGVFSQVGVSVFVRFFFRFWAWVCRPGVFYWFWGLPNMSAWLMRWLCPVNSMSRPWWTMRSMIEAASLSSAKIVPHSPGLDVRGGG